MALKRIGRSALVVLALVGLLAYLRDPPWLLNATSGLGQWQTDESGEPYRWTKGRASLFVPAESTSVVLTMRALKDAPADWPINVTIGVDGRPSQLLPLPDESWRSVTIELPPGGNRDVRRIDIHLDRVRREQRGVQLRRPLLYPR